MSVVVFGATGHIGGNLVRALVAQGRSVRAFAHQPSNVLDGLPVEFVQGDVLDAEAVERAVAGAEVVFNLAARISLVAREAATVLRVNVGGTKNIVNACLTHRVRRLVHFSSIHALSPYPREEVVDESRPPNLFPETFAYDRSKALGEAEVMAGVQRGLDAVILNPTAVLGPHEYGTSHQSNALLQIYHREIPAIVVGGFNWVDVRDVVESTLAAEKRGRTGERYLLGGRWATIRELADLIVQVTGANATRTELPLWVAQAVLPMFEGIEWLTGWTPPFNRQMLGALHQHRHISSEKAQNELGHRARPLEQTVADVFTWYEAAGRLRVPPSRQLATYNPLG